MKKRFISVAECDPLLDALGSNQDPIYIGGIETTPQDLAYSEHADKDARRFMIKFYGGRGKQFRLRYASLMAMIQDRMDY